MKNAVCFYFQVHQPYRLRRDFSFFSIGGKETYEDETKNAAIMRKVAEKCYLPANAVMKELIDQHEGKFRISYSISGTALDQFAQYAPEVLESFQDLARTGCVEFLGETYYHSLAFLFSDAEFKRQVRLHSAKIEELFGQKPSVFRDTELIYENRLAGLVEELGFQACIAEGADRVLGWRSPNYVYRAVAAPNVRLLLKNYSLSDDIAFRFGNRAWEEWPLTADKFSRWAHQVAGNGHTINLFMDYETFGEHQWAETGIFDFLRHLPEAILRHPDFAFMTPREVIDAFEPVGEMNFPTLVSWADTERDVSAWLGNSMQNAAARSVFGMERDVLATKDEHLLNEWRKLQTSDHFYYMCVKYFADGDVHKYFNPYESPYDAFIYYTNALNQLRWQVADALQKRREEAEAATRKPRGKRRDLESPTLPH